MIEPAKRELLSIPMPVGPNQHDLAGPQKLYPYLDASITAPRGAKTVLLVCHPSGNFLNHYLMGPLAERGLAVCGLNTRYAGNDSQLIVENVVLDIGAAVRYLRSRFENVILVGNSGGGSVTALYQGQAETPTITQTPAGDPFDIAQADLMPTDAFVAVAAHPSRAQVLTDAMDPAVTNESDPTATDPELDMFDPRNGPPYSEDWLEQYRKAQRARNDRITDRVLADLSALKSKGPVDQAFLVHRTSADPRFLDLSIDPSDREIGSLYGDPKQANFAAAGGLARFTSLRSWLSQWSASHTNASGPKALSSTSVPALILNFTADRGAFTSYARAYHHAVTHQDKRLVHIEGATHYLYQQPEQTANVADTIASWLHETGLADG